MRVGDQQGEMNAAATALPPPPPICQSRSGCQKRKYRALAAAAGVPCLRARAR